MNCEFITKELIKLTIAIIDDFEQDRINIAENTERFFKEYSDLCTQFFFYNNGEAFLEELTPNFFDLVILDCCMEGLDGLETAKKMRNIDSKTALIFITFCQDYAVGGYLVSALGYLLKPYTYSDFFHVFENAYCKILKKAEVIIFQDRSNIKKILIDDIVYCDIQGHYIQIHLTNHQICRIRMTFSSLETLLSPYPQFLECYRGCLINMAHTYKAEELNFLMDTGERVPFRKKEHNRLLKKYSDYLFEKIRIDYT